MLQFNKTKKIAEKVAKFVVFYAFYANVGEQFYLNNQKLSEGIFFLKKNNIKA